MLACRFLACAVVLVGTISWVWGWTRAHDQASRMPALAGLVPEPFRSHPDHCAFGVYPDRMNDWDIAQGENGRWAVLLLVRAAVEALRQGDGPQACFLASVASHYPQDALCMSHSPLLMMSNARASADLLPASVRPLLDKLPVERASREVRRYGRGRKAELMKNRGFFTAQKPPELLPELYTGVQGYVHDWLEDTAAALSLPPAQRAAIVGGQSLGQRPAWTWPEILRRRSQALQGTPLERLAEYERGNGIEGWSFYHRWLAAEYQGQWLLPFALWHHWPDKPAFRDSEALQAVFAEEFRIGVEATATLYRYVAVAAQTQVVADWGPLKDHDARFEALVKEDVTIQVAQDRPDWRRAAAFLQQELLFARQRQKSQASIVLQTKPSDAPPAPPGHWIVLEKGTAYRLDIRPRAAGSPWLVVRLQVPEKDQAAMSHLVDLLLDHAQAPLWSTSPPETVLKALRVYWAGSHLMKDLRTQKRSPQELLEFVRTIPYRNTQDDKARFADAVRSTQRTPGLHPWLRWWQTYTP